MSKLTERTVLFDVYCWLTPTDDPKRPDQHVARRGDVIEISAAEAERGESLGALGSPEDLAEIEAAANGVDDSGAPKVSSVPDEQLAGMNVETLVAHLGQFPQDVDRVVALEEQRGKPRKGVLEAAEKVRAAYEEAIAEQVAALEAGEDLEQRAYETSTGKASAAPSIP